MRETPESELPDKPQIEDMPPEEGIEPPEDDDELDEGTFLSPEQAREDETVDDEENDSE